MSEASIQKIRSSHVKNISAEEYAGYQGLIWFDEFTGELRIWDNNVPGGRLIYNNGPGATNKLVNGAYEFSLGSTGNVTAQGSLLPNANVSYDLGSPTNAWRSLYISGNTLYIANENMSVNSSTGVWNFTSNGAAISMGANSIFANIAANSVSASGNITADYFVGNGSQLTGLPATYSNAQVSTYLASGTNSANIVTSANISGNYFVGNGSQLTGINVSSNKIFNGNSYANIPVANGNVNIGAGGNIWAFDTTGNLTLPSGPKLMPGYPGGGYIANVASLAGTDVYLANIDGSSWIGIDGGTPRMGWDSTNKYWNFGSDGNLTLPSGTPSINYANGTPYGGGASSLPPQTGNVGKILSTDGTNPLWAAMPGVFGLVIDGGSAAYSSPDFIIDGGAA